MLIEKEISVSSYQRILNLGIALFFSLAVLIPLGAFVESVLLDSSDFSSNSWSSLIGREKESEKKRVLSTDEKIKNSFISFNTNVLKNFPFPELEKQFVILEHISRPDFIKKEGLFLIGLENSHEKRLASQGQKIFLECKNEEKISFSDENTPFWLEFYVKENGLVEVRLFSEFKERDDSVFYSYNQVFVTSFKKDFSQSSGFEKNDLAPMIAFLGKIKVSEPDLLIEMYGGKTFESVKGLYRMSNNLDHFFIKAGELFAWRNGKLESEKNKTLNYPLLLVKSIDAYKCEMVLWDVEGIYCKSVTIPVSKSLPSALKIGDFFNKIHQRTEVSVTCQLHNRNIILRKGDWFLYHKGSFRNLRTADEIKDYLRYALKGELFIFDGIVKKEGVTLFAGHLFNEERTGIKKIEIPLAERKKTQPIKKKESKVAPVQVKDE
jgi:hypothetical protein